MSRLSKELIRLFTPFDQTRWNLATLAIAMAGTAVATGVTFLVIFPSTGVPVVAAWLPVNAITIVVWSVFIRRDAATAEGEE